MKNFNSSNEKRCLKNLGGPTILWPFIAFLACLTLGLSPLNATPEVKNENSGREYTDLQAAIVDASVGDTLKLKGKFFGNFIISKNLTLIGHHDATLDGNQTGSVLTVVGNTTVVYLEHLTLKNGLNATNPGGGIFNDAATIYLKHVDVLHNTALIGAGIGNVFGTILLDECKIHNNTSDEVGGGIASIGGGNTISNTSISFNAAGYGGGIYNSAGLNVIPSNTNLKKVKLEGNYAALSGGAIANVESSVINGEEAKIEDNTAQEYGGGLYNIQASTANFSDSKINKNNVLIHHGGGGIYSSGSSLNLLETEVEHNIPNNLTET